MSFRALAKQKDYESSDGALGCVFTPAPSENKESTQGCVTMPPEGQTTPRPKHVTLVAGDSYGARLDPVKLGKRRVHVVSIARGGAKMDHVGKQLREFYDTTPNVIVDKLFISVGTNDIRNCKNGVSHLKGPLKVLCKSINELFPNTRVFFQTLLPLPLKFEYDWYTNATVWEFNRIIYNECIYRRFYIIDAFFQFRDQIYWDRPMSRCEPLFEDGGIHPNIKLGMGVLARLYIRAIHSRYFDPFVYQ